MEVGIIGGGTMGIGIAYAFLTHDSTVYIVEPLQTQTQFIKERIPELIATGVQRGHISESQTMTANESLTIYSNIQQLPQGLDWIIEAVPEDLSLKQSIVVQAEQREPTALASNTSALSITTIAGPLRHPERFIGLHFFNPVWSMKLVEIVLGERSSEDSTELARQTVAMLGKTSIVVKDTPGFASSRLGVLLGLEAIRMLEQGIASASDIDTAMTLGYGHPMGPLRLTDLVGLDVRLKIAMNLEKVYGERFSPPQLLIDLVSANHLGRKTGQGFYTW